MRLSFDNLYAVISPEFFGDSVHIKGSYRFKKADYFRHLQYTGSGSEILLPLFIWADNPNKSNTASKTFTTTIRYIQDDLGSKYFDFSMTIRQLQLT
jgi:hypothetical protein